MRRRHTTGFAWSGTPFRNRKSSAPDRRRETVSNPIFSPAPRGPSRFPGHPAHSQCAPSAAGLRDPQTPPAAPSVFPPSSREPGDRGEERDAPHRRPDPGSGRRRHRGPLSPPLGPPDARTPAERRGLVPEPTPARPLPLTVAAASSRRPSLQAAPANPGAADTQARAVPRRSPPAPGRRPRPLEPGQATPPGVCARASSGAWPRPPAVWTAATCWAAYLWLQ